MLWCKKGPLHGEMIFFWVVFLTLCIYIPQYHNSGIVNVILSLASFVFMFMLLISDGHEEESWETNADEEVWESSEKDD